MSKSTISTFKLFETTRKAAGFYRCNACGDFDFTVRTGTIFERSHIPLHKWVYAMYLLVTARKGISSMQLAKEIGVTQKSAWFMLSRLREACGNDSDLDKLRGVIEIDEAFFGGKDANKHAHLRAGRRGGKGKTAVLGMREAVPPLCPDSPDGNHHVAPIGSDEEWMSSKAPCYYCGEKQAL